MAWTRVMKTDKETIKEASRKYWEKKRKEKIKEMEKKKDAK